MFENKTIKSITDYLTAYTKLTQKHIKESQDLFSNFFSGKSFEKNKHSSAEHFKDFGEKIQKGVQESMEKLHEKTQEQLINLTQNVQKIHEAQHDAFHKFVEESKKISEKLHK